MKNGGEQNLNDRMRRMIIFQAASVMKFKTQSALNKCAHYFPYLLDMIVECCWQFNFWLQFSFTRIDFVFFGLWRI